MQRITTRLLIMQKLDDVMKRWQRMLFPNSNGTVGRKSPGITITCILIVVCRKIGYHAQGGQQYLTFFFTHTTKHKTLFNLVRVTCGRL
jgi:hypothetical protein